MMVNCCLGRALIAVKEVFLWWKESIKIYMFVHRKTENDNSIMGLPSGMCRMSPRFHFTASVLSDKNLSFSRWCSSFNEFPQNTVILCYGLVPRFLSSCCMEAFVLRGSWGVPWPPLPGGWSLVELSCEETLRLCLLLTGEHDLFMYKGLNKPKDNSKGSAKMLLSFFFFFFPLCPNAFSPGALFAIPLVAKSAHVTFRRLNLLSVK